MRHCARAARIGFDSRSDAWQGTGRIRPRRLVATPNGCGIGAWAI
jgi:hypothetical protein